MTNQIQKTSLSQIAGVEHVLLTGDLARLSSADRLRYYGQVCESVGLNPLTQPFEYLKLNGKTILYARKAATEQLRQIHNISLTIVHREVIAGCQTVTARATTPNGRTDESIGCVPLYNPNTGEELVGEALCNAIMKAETKAKRRVTLAICGLAMLDETEADTIKGAEHVVMGELEDPRPSAPVIQLPSAREPENQGAPVHRMIEVTMRRGTKSQVGQVTEEMFQKQLNACMTEPQLIDWAVRVLRTTLPDFTKRELRTMLKRHATRLQLDHNQITARAKQIVEK